jgi:hypothetical protein
MQVSRRQAARAIDAVRRSQRRASTRRRRARHPVPGVRPVTIDRALARIEAAPRVRVEVVAAASARLAAGDRPSADAIAAAALRHGIHLRPHR